MRRKVINTNVMHFSVSQIGCNVMKAIHAALAMPKVYINLGSACGLSSVRHQAVIFPNQC